MTIPYRRVIITLSGLIGLAVAIGWLFYFPFSEARLYRGAAPHAVLISEHERLAERWSDLLANPQLAGILDATVGAQDPGETQAILDLLGQPLTTRLVELLGQEKVVVSYVPRATPHGGDCWTVSAWVGGTTQLLRWGWLDRTLGDLKPTLRARGIKGWQQALELDGKSYQLGMVAFEGVVALTLSRDPSAVTWMANRLLGDAPFATANGLVQPTSLAPTSPDRLAMRPGRLSIPRPFYGSLRVDFPTLGANGVDLTLHCRGQKSTPTLGSAPLTRLPIPATMPAALACTSVSNLTAMIDQLLDPAVAAPLRPLLSLANPASPLGVALGTTAYSGRLMGVRTPSLLACARTDIPQEELAPRLRSLVDHWVAASGTGLIVTKDKERPGMLIVSFSQSPALAMLGRAELCAITVQAGWLYLCSSPAVLTACLEAVEAGAPTFDSDRLWGEQAAAAALWVDAAPTAESIGNALAVYNLIGMFSGGKNMQRLDTPAVKQAMAIFAELGEGRAWVSANGRELTSRIRLQ